jgi:hypothetical protein
VDCTLPEKVRVQWSDGVPRGGLQTVCMHLDSGTVHYADREWPARRASDVWRETLCAATLEFRYCDTRHLLMLARRSARAREFEGEEGRERLIALLTREGIARPSRWYLLRLARSTSGLIRPAGPDDRPTFCTLSFCLAYGLARTELAKAAEWMREQQYDVPADLAEAIAIAQEARAYRRFEERKRNSVRAAGQGAPRLSDNASRPGRAACGKAPSESTGLPVARRRDVLKP